MDLADKILQSLRCFPTFDTQELKTRLVELIDDLKRKEAKSFDHSLIISLDDVLLSDIFIELPSQHLLSEYGHDAVMWTWLRHKYSDRLRDLLAETYGYNKDYLQRAKDTVRRNRRGDNPRLLQKNYDLINAMCTGILDGIDLPEILTEHKKQNFPKKDGEVKSYALALMIPYAKGSWGQDRIWNMNRELDGLRYNVHLAGPVGIGLMYKSIPRAVVSFYAPDAQTIKILQLQGVKPQPTTENGDSWCLGTIRWAEVLVKCTETVGKKLGFRQAMVRSALHNQFVEFSDKEGIRIYDKTAENLGYEGNSHIDWTKQI